MDIRTAMDRLIVIQASLKITSPVKDSIRKAYKYMPPANVAVPDMPCFMNAWTFVEEERTTSSGVRIQRYTVHSQLFVQDADQDRAADIASAFHVAYIDALDADIKLAGTVTDAIPRGGSPTLAILERANLAFVGLDLFLDMTLKEAKSYA